MLILYKTNHKSKSFKAH